MFIAGRPRRQQHQSSRWIAFTWTLRMWTRSLFARARRASSSWPSKARYSIPLILCSVCSTRYIQWEEVTAIFSVGETGNEILSVLPNACSVFTAEGSPQGCAINLSDDCSDLRYFKGENSQARIHWLWITDSWPDFYCWNRWWRVSNQESEKAAILLRHVSPHEGSGYTVSGKITLCTASV